MVNYVEIKHLVPGNQWVKDEIKGKFKIILKQVIHENITYKNL